MKRILSLLFLLFILYFSSLSYADCVVMVKSGNVRSGPSTKHKVIKSIAKWEIICDFYIEGNWIFFKYPEVVDKNIKYKGWTFWDPGCLSPGTPCKKSSVGEKVPIIMLNNRGDQSNESEKIGIVIKYTGKERSKVKMWSRGWGDYRTYCAEVIYNPIGPKKYFIHRSLLEIVEGSKKDAERYIKIRKSVFLKSIKSKLIKREVWIGMTKEMTILSWGKPDHINKTITATILNEQWVYEYGSYKMNFLYFKNDKLTVIQTR